MKSKSAIKSIDLGFIGANHVNTLAAIMRNCKAITELTFFSYFDNPCPKRHISCYQQGRRCARITCRADGEMHECPPPLNQPIILAILFWHQHPICLSSLPLTSWISLALSSFFVTSIWATDRIQHCFNQYFMRKFAEEICSSSRSVHGCGSSYGHFTINFPIAANQMLILTCSANNLPSLSPLKGGISSKKKEKANSFLLRKAKNFSLPIEWHWMKYRKKKRSEL